MFANYKTDCLVKNQDDVVAEIDKFLDVFKLYQNAVSGEANYQLKRNRETRLRHLPWMSVAELSAMGLAAVYDNGTVYSIMDSIIWCRVVAMRSSPAPTIYLKIKPFSNVMCVQNYSIAMKGV